MKIAKMIGIILMVIFGISSFFWLARMFGLMGMRFNEEDLSTVFGNIAIFIVGVIITVATNKKIRKK